WWLLPPPARAQQSARPRSAAERAWDRHDLAGARAAYLAELAARRKDDTAWYNAGTAALADSDAETARGSLTHAAASLDPDVRFRALFNLGLLALHEAMADSAARDSRLADAERAYREALLLRPHDLGGAGVQGGMSPAQADEVLRSIGQQELKTRRDRTGQTRRAVEPGVKDW